MDALTFPELQDRVGRLIRQRKAEQEAQAEAVQAAKAPVHRHSKR